MIKFVIEEYHKEEDPAFLAMCLAEALHNASVAQTDYESFRASANAEKQKANSLNHIIFQLKERNRSGFISTSRMDPLASYNLDDCVSQLNKIKERVIEFTNKSNEALIAAETARRESKRLQIELKRLNMKARS